jgi:protein-glutamine gamma-glutamyltransferase
VATWAVLASATRLVVSEPAWGARSLAVFGSVAVLFSGYAKLSWWYSAGACAFVFALGGASRAADVSRPSLHRLKIREWSAAGAIVVGTLCLSIVSGVGLPRAYEWLMSKYVRTAEDLGTTGFTPWLELGPMQSMTQSDEIVLRVYGRAPAYLRGMVYDRYDRGRWRNLRSPASTVVRLQRGPLVGNNVVRVERVAGLDGWYFLPLGVRGIATETAAIRRDALGTVRGVPGDMASQVWFKTDAGDTLVPAEPRAADTEVPQRLRGLLTEFSHRWTLHAHTDAERMAALRTHLRTEYRYSLHFDRSRTLDPVEDFLTVHREGHCEYFASTLALLGRTLAIPTRVIGGYRIAERNPFGGYHIAREKNAHSWIEAWFDGAWHTVDATPAGALPHNEQHNSVWYRSMSEFFGERIRHARQWIATEGTTFLLLTAAALLTLWLGYRTWRARTSTKTHSTISLQDQSLPCFDDLSLALQHKGITREPSETLTTFAARISASELPEDVRQRVSEIIQRYATMRYATTEQEQEIVMEMKRTAERVRSAMR